MPPSTLWRVSAQGGAPVEITHRNTPPGGHGAPAWSPDGKRLVFVASDVAVAALWTVWISMSTKQQKQLTHDTSLDTYVRYPAWSPRGDQIVYERAEAIGNIWVLELR